MSRESIRDRIALLDTNYIGQEGRGAAASVRDKALTILDDEWAAEDAAEHRREQLIAALRSEMLAAAKGITGLNAPDYVADHLAGSLAMFILSIDDRTWEPPQ